MYPPDTQALRERIVRTLISRSGRLTVLIALGYLAGGLGVAVAFLGGIDEPTSDFAALGILLLFLSFACMFYVSVTMIDIGAG